MGDLLMIGPQGCLIEVTFEQEVLVEEHLTSFTIDIDHIHVSKTELQHFVTFL